MVATASLTRQFLYYWSKLYSQQLPEADDYSRLCATISICFVNDDASSGRDARHSRYRLLEEDERLCLTADLAIHVIEIPKCCRTLSELEEPPDFWLYFLTSGLELDADALPTPLNKPELCRAMEVLKMLSQSVGTRCKQPRRLSMGGPFPALSRDACKLPHAKRTSEKNGRGADRNIDDRKMK